MQKTATQPKPQEPGHRPEAVARKRPKRQPLPLQRKAYKIGEFCAVHGISKAKYFELKKAGKGPRETQFEEDGIILISEEAAAEWRAGGLRGR